MFRLDGKTALITGGARGIGLAIAKLFAAQGARVILADRDRDSVAATAEQLGADGVSVRAVSCDVADPGSVAAAAERLKDCGEDVAILVNNAGIIHVGTILDATIEDLRRVYQVNVEGVFNVTKAVLPGMIARGGGVILNMASLASLTAMQERFVYASSKAAVLMMTRSIAFDFAKQNIRANCICPARVHTDLVDNYLKDFYGGHEEETFRKFSEYQPLGRMIKPAEIAHLALYLCSDEAAMVTGASYLIDGGVLAGA